MDRTINLQDFHTNIFSQNGEDGTIEKIFGTLGVESGSFCEFGAWDGRHLSNTFRLYQKGWAGWYIEGDRSRFRDLIANVTGAEVEKICAWVTVEGNSTLDKLLTNSILYKEGKVRSIDLLSIDIDSDDLAIWRSIKDFRPTVVVIEYNPTIPFDVFFENPAGENKGNSARSIYEYANTIGYSLIAITACNLIFIDKSRNKNHFEVVDLCDPQIKGGARYFFGYDGTFIHGSAGKGAKHQVSEIMSVPWAKSVFTQPVVKPARVFGRPLYCRVNFVTSLVSAAIRRPFSTAVKIVEKFSRNVRNLHLK
jgi:hypothetical protein